MCEKYQLPSLPGLPASVILRPSQSSSKQHHTMVLHVQGIGKAQLLGSQLCLHDLLATSSHRVKTLELLYPVLLPSNRDCSSSILTILQNLSITARVLDKSLIENRVGLVGKVFIED